MSHLIRPAFVVCPLYDVPFLCDKRVDLCQFLRVACNELHNLVLHGKKYPLFKVTTLADIQQTRDKLGIIHLAMPSETLDNMT